MITDLLFQMGKMLKAREGKVSKFVVLVSPGLKDQIETELFAEAMLHPTLGQPGAGEPGPPIEVKEAMFAIPGKAMIWAEPVADLEWKEKVFG